MQQHRPNTPTDSVPSTEELSTEHFDIKVGTGHGTGPASRPSNSNRSDSDSASGDSDVETYWGTWARAESDGNLDWDGEEDWDDLEDGLRRQVDQFADDKSNVNSDTPSDDGEVGQKIKNPDYQFCPPVHRLSILRLFAKHASQHPLLPERHGERHAKDDIRQDAVEEMYRHCEVNNLCKVWAYLWNSWYSQEQWPLWARGAYASSIPCKRTTMMVEAL